MTQFNVEFFCDLFKRFPVSLFPIYITLTTIITTIAPLAPNIKVYRPTLRLLGNNFTVRMLYRTVIDLCISCVPTTVNEDDDDNVSEQVSK